MRTRRLFNLLLVGMMVSLLLSACQTPSASGAQISNDFESLVVTAKDCDYGGVFRSMEAIDSLTVKLTLCKPDPALLAKLASPVFSIQDAEVFNTAQGKSALLSENVVASGPYTVKEYSKGDQLVLTINPSYWGEPPKNKEVIFRWAENQGTRQADLQFLSADAADNLNVASFAPLLREAQFKLYYRPGLNTAYLGMNNKVAPFDNELVRQAFSMALDRKNLVEETFPQGTTLAQQFVPSIMKPGFSDVLLWTDYGPNNAIYLLEQAGYDFDTTIQLHYPSTPQPFLPDPEKTATMIQQQLGEIGVQVTLVPTTNFYFVVSKGQVGLFLYGTVADYADPTAFYDAELTGPTTLFGSPYPDIIEQLDLASSVIDSITRQQYYDVVNELIKQHVPMIPLAHTTTGVGFKGNINHVQIGAQTENIEEMSSERDTLVFLQESEPKSLWPGDESTVDTLRVNRLLYSTLVEYASGSTEITPGLAEYWEVNSDLTEWTFSLRYNAKFSNGKPVDANDVVTSLSAMWDASSPNHTGNRGEFQYFKQFFGEFINLPED